MGWVVGWLVEGGTLGLAGEEGGCWGLFDVSVEGAGEEDEGGECAPDE